MNTIYREDAASIILDLPGDHQHVVSAEVLFKSIAQALKGGYVLYGGRTALRVDANGRVYVNEELAFEPKGIRQLELPGVDA